MERDRVVGEEGVGPRGDGSDFERRIELEPFLAGDVGELEPVDRPLGEVVAPGRHQRFGVEAPELTDIPVDLHPVGADEAADRG